MTELEYWVHVLVSVPRVSGTSKSTSTTNADSTASCTFRLPVSKKTHLKSLTEDIILSIYIYI